MTKQEFQKIIANGPVILDGAMGTGLMKAGMSVDECTEKWAVEHPDIVMGIQKAYIEAGASMVGGCCGTTPEYVKALAEATKGMELRKPLEMHRRIRSQLRWKFPCCGGTYQPNKKESISGRAP